MSTTATSTTSAWSCWKCPTTIIGTWSWTATTDGSRFRSPRFSTDRARGQADALLSPQHRGIVRLGEGFGTPITTARGTVGIATLGSAVIRDCPLPGGRAPYRGAAGEAI